MLSWWWLYIVKTSCQLTLIIDWCVLTDLKLECLFNDAFYTLNAQMFTRLRTLRLDSLVKFRMKMFPGISSYIHIPTTALLLDTVINNLWWKSYMFLHFPSIFREAFNKEKLLYYMCVYNLDNNYWDIYSALYFLNIFIHFYILNFKCSIAHLCYNKPFMYFSSLNASLKTTEKGRNM
jgi:hypothetical protein